MATDPFNRCTWKHPKDGRQCAYPGHHDGKHFLLKTPLTSEGLQRVAEAWYLPKEAADALVMRTLTRAQNISDELKASKFVQFVSALTSAASALHNDPRA